MVERKRIPRRIEREILFRSEMVCCVCGSTGVQIHHLDGNPSNNDITNLCVLCVKHHAEASSTSTMTRKLDAALLRKFRGEHEAQVAKRRRLASPQREIKIGERELARFEIKRLIYSLPTKRTRQDVKAVLDDVYHWYLVEGMDEYRDHIIYTFSLSHYFLEESQTPVVLDYLWNLFWHFIGPEDVSMDTKDERSLFSAIKLIGYIVTFAEAVDYGPKVVKAGLATLENLSDIARWYKKARIHSEIQRQLEQARSEWEEGHASAKGTEKRKKRLALNEIEKALARHKRKRPKSR